MITGAADDDPSGIATYSQAGAQFGFQLAWTLVLSYPLMVVIQATCARIGRTTGQGLAGNLRAHYPAWVVNGVVALLFVANTLNIGADLGAMGEAMTLLVAHVRPWVFIGAFGILCTAAQIVLQHTRYVATLKWLTLALFSYFAALLAVHIDWVALIKGLLLPQLTKDRDFWLTVVAILGTTISPYLFFWQAAQEVEDTKADPQQSPLLDHPSEGARALSRIRLDTLVGMGFSNLVAIAIMVIGAATLHATGHFQIDTAGQAAEALRPIAGEFAFAVFSVGIIGTGLLSIPVLAGSAAYALGEARGWPVGLSRRPLQAKAFYSAIAVATLLGAVGNVIGVNPIRALVWTAVINGVLATPVMALLMMMATNRKIMGQFAVSRRWSTVGWLATGLMGAASVAFLIASV